MQKRGRNYATPVVGAATLQRKMHGEIFTTYNTTFVENQKAKAGKIILIKTPLNLCVFASCSLQNNHLHARFCSRYCPFWSLFCITYWSISLNTFLWSFHNDRTQWKTESDHEIWLINNLWTPDHFYATVPTERQYIMCPWKVTFYGHQINSECLQSWWNFIW